MRTVLLGTATTIIVVAVVIWTLVLAVGRNRTSYSSFSLSYWEEVYPPTFDVSPSGNTLVFTAHGDGGRDLYTFHPQTKRALQVSHSPQFEAEVRFVNENTVVVSAVEDPRRVSSPQHLYLVDVDNGSRRKLTTDPRMRDSTIVVLSHDQVLFSRAEIRKQFNPVWGFVVEPWGFMDVYGVLVGDYLLNLQTGSIEQIHHTSPGIYLDQVGAVFANRQKVIQLVSRGMTSEMLLTYLSSPLGSAEIRAIRKKLLAHDAISPVLSGDERLVYYITRDISGTQYDIMRLDLSSLKSTRLVQRDRRITCLRLCGSWLFFLEGSGKDVTLWRMHTHGKRLEKLLSPSQFANPLGK